MKCTVTVLALSFLMVGPVQSQGPDPVGDEFQVNTYTTYDQRLPAVAADAQGNFVVVWQSLGSYGTDTDEWSVQGQRYDASGGPVGEQFQVNSYTTDGQFRPEVAVDADGNFVVVWFGLGSSGSDSSYTSVQARRYDASGAAVGGEFQVNSYTTTYQSSPKVAMGAQGNFVVVWDSLGSYGDDSASFSIQAQLYDAEGNTVGGEFQVNSYTTSHQFAPRVAVGTQGDFVVVWDSVGSGGTDTSSYSIQGQRYDATGAPVGEQFQVNSYTTGAQARPNVAVDTQSNFVVVWNSQGSYGTDTEISSVQGQRYDAEGNTVGGEFQVNSYTTNNQDIPNVAIDAQGNFVVIWQSYGSGGTDTSSYSIQGQRYDTAGTPVGGESQVNSYTTDAQWTPAVAVQPQGDFVVVWSSYGSHGTDTSAFSIQGQRFSTAIFTDGFESGDTSAWSNSVP